ncbi:NF-kappa-B inhibitor-like protein 1 [Lineus longissimus]|uniref:NF-kappa-B inhibitor-like protein 1 n=1 Tax=Lineus longissimus TaxID=88925 RepID=UPI002B4E9AB7
MGNKRREEKLKKLLEDADLSKIRSYIRKHRLKVNRIVESDKSRTVLHLACVKGRDDVVRYLLKKGADASLGDEHGDTALHLAAKRAIAGEKYAFQDLVQPLMLKCPEALRIRNKCGDSARRLVQIYEDGLKSSQTYELNCLDSESSDESTAEERWQRKLRDEVDHEYGAWASYEEDYYQDRDEETYEDWVDRIRFEKQAKYWQNVVGGANSGATKQKVEDKDQEAREFQKKLEKDHELYQEKMKKKMQERKQQGAILKKKLYEQKWTDIFSEIKNGMHMSFSDIPWPDGLSNSPDIVREFLFCDFGEEETTLRKKYLRSQQVRWHPDKFMQKFGQNLLQTDRERILEKVKRVSQVMNQLNESIL